MALINIQKRGVPPFPDPNDTDQGRINRTIIELVRYLIVQNNQLQINARLSALEEKVSQIEDSLNR